MNKEFSDRIDYLTNLFKTNNDQQNSNFQYMETQTRVLHEQHDKMNEIGASSEGKTGNLEDTIGI